MSHSHIRDLILLISSAFKNYSLYGQSMIVSSLSLELDSAQC